MGQVSGSPNSCDHAKELSAYLTPQAVEESGGKVHNLSSTNQLPHPLIKVKKTG